MAAQTFEEYSVDENEVTAAGELSSAAAEPAVHGLTWPDT